jgi:pimeloyl-ACP methyl ester carboxylesterase
MGRLTHLSPLVLLHGFMDTPRTWELVRPALAREHELLAPALAGETEDDLLEGVEQAMDDAGWTTAHLAGNSLGGWLALQLAARGRAESVVALAPAGGWAEGDASRDELFALQLAIHAQATQLAPHADAIVATLDGRRRATALITVNHEHIPADLLADQLRAVAATPAGPMIDRARTSDWRLDADRIDCPVRIVWGTDDRLLPWPSAAERFRREWLPHADWVELEAVGHCPQLDVPLETAQLILGLTR